MNRRESLRPIVGALLLAIAGSAMLPHRLEAADASRCSQPDRPARLVHLAKAAYPMLAMQVGARGTFRVHVTLSKKGKVVSATIPAVPHPFAGLDPDAIAAARASTYAPALKNCTPVEASLIVPVTFPPH